MIARLVAIVIAAALAGCGSSWNPWAKAETPASGPYTPPGAKGYACEGGKRLLVRQEDAKSMWIIYPDRQMRLDRTASGSGEEYSRAGTTLSIRDGEATLFEGSSVQFSKCQPEKS